MKTATFAVALLGLLPSAFAQTLAASPTESYGCEPHGDHYHCEGARATLSTVVSQAAAATTTEAHDHDDHDDETGTGSAAASPTESYGCEAHGDHWHCDGARATTGRSDSTPAASDSTPTASGNAVTATGAAGMEMVPILGMVAAAVLAL